MYEHKLEFLVVPKSKSKTIGLIYSYRYYTDSLIEMSVSYNPETKNLCIIDFSRCGMHPRYENYGYKHLGTKLFIDVIVDIKCRFGFEIKTIRGKLKESDKNRHHWKKSIPFYAHFPQYIMEKVDQNVSFFLKDKSDKLLWTEIFGYDIIEDLDEIIENNEEMNFLYTFE